MIRASRRQMLVMTAGCAIRHQALMTKRQISPNSAASFSVSTCQQKTAVPLLLLRAFGHLCSISYSSTRCVHQGLQRNLLVIRGS